MKSYNAMLLERFYAWPDRFWVDPSTLSLTNRKLKHGKIAQSKSRTTRGYGKTWCAHVVLTKVELCNIATVVRNNRRNNCCVTFFYLIGLRLSVEFDRRSRSLTHSSCCCYILERAAKESRERVRAAKNCSNKKIGSVKGASSSKKKNRHVT